MSIKAIIWDLGGVILRTEEGEHREELASQYKTTRDQLEYEVFASPPGVQAQIGEIHPDQLWEYIGNRFELSPDEIDDFQERYWAGDQVDEALVETVRHLQGKYKTALLSNAWLDLREYLENVWKIADAFDVMIISGEVGMVKPDPRIYQIALNELDIEAHEAVFIDDFAHNIEGAHGVGMNGIHFQSAEQTLRELGELLDGEPGV